MRHFLMMTASSLILGGCAIPQDMDQPQELLQGSIPTIAETPASEALNCLSDVPRPSNFDIRLAVGEIPDLTGRFDYNDLGAFISQGATNMMISAIGETDIPQVNRFTTGIAEWELDQAVERRLGEGRTVQAGNQQVSFRPVPFGSITGSTHYITGAITELDFNVYQRVNELNIAGFGAGNRAFLAQVAMDIAVTDTRSTEILFSRPYRKQILGYEIQGEVFRIFDLGDGLGQIEGNELIDISVSNEPNEPLQGAVRWVTELAAYDIVSDALNAGSRCDDRLNPAQQDYRRDAMAPEIDSNETGADGAPSPGQTPETDAARESDADTTPSLDSLTGRQDLPSIEDREEPATQSQGDRQTSPTRPGCRIIGGREVCPD